MTTTSPTAPAHGSSISRNIEIGGMTGDACVSKVVDALKGVPHVATKFVKVGSAVIGSDQSGCTAACTAITKAGFEAHEDTRSNADRNAANAAAKSNPTSNGARPASPTPSTQAPANQPASNRPASNQPASNQPATNQASHTPTAAPNSTGGCGTGDKQANCTKPEAEHAKPKLAAAVPTA